MDDATIEAFRQQLVAQQLALQTQEQEHNTDSGPVELDQARVGRLSRMDAMQGQQMALQASRRRQAQLANIAGALRRIESNSFGDCFICGEEIDQRRLAIDPTSTRCLGCTEV
ncbi:MAG: TraR/DksA C4-type zinc finger protein [Gammaproteobacteria bacterium]